MHDTKELSPDLQYRITGKSGIWRFSNTVGDKYTFRGEKSVVLLTQEQVIERVKEKNHA